jgi:Fe2+ transport system protein FeoA
MQVDRCILRRLLELGLTPGVEVRVVQDAGGPMLVSVRGSRVALGRDLAEKMWVELATPDRDGSPS